MLRTYTIGRTTQKFRADVEEARLDEAAGEAEWGREKGRVRELVGQIEHCRLLAPGDGLLVVARDPARAESPPIEGGATVRERQKVFSVIDPAEPMRIDATVREAVVHRVEPGQAVRIAVDALPGRALTGVVRAVAPRPDAVVAGGEKLYPISIQLDQGVPGLRPGMSAAVEIRIFELDEVLAVPVASVVPVDDGHRVAVQAPGGAVEWRGVALGATNAESVEVRRGLRPGDRVLLAPPRRGGDPTKATHRRRRPRSPAPPPAGPGVPRSSHDPAEPR